MSTVTRLAWPTLPVAPSLATAFERGPLSIACLNSIFEMAVVPEVDADADV
ncbi:MAG: hypothetical protein M9928_12335 [Anaerolineae bacterium]|nr:hypothetical protein [Anaerolineae bacterium]